MNFLEALELANRGMTIEREDGECRLRVLDGQIKQMMLGSSFFELSNITQDDQTAEWVKVEPKRCPHCDKIIEEN